MTHNERLIGVLTHGHVDRVVDYEFGLWLQTYDCWVKEGFLKAGPGMILPKGVTGHLQLRSKEPITAVRDDKGIEIAPSRQTGGHKGQKTAAIDYRKAI